MCFHKNYEVVIFDDVGYFGGKFLKGSLNPSDIERNERNRLRVM